MNSSIKSAIKHLSNYSQKQNENEEEKRLAQKNTLFDDINSASNYTAAGRSETENLKFASSAFGRGIAALTKASTSSTKNSDIGFLNKLTANNEWQNKAGAQDDSKPENSYADHVAGMDISNKRAKKYSLKYARNLEESLTKFSDLSNSNADKIMNNYEGSMLDNIHVAANAVEAGIYKPGDMTNNQETLIKDFLKYKDLAGKPAFNKYRELLSDYMDKGIIPDYVGKHVNAVEKAGNWGLSTANSVGAFGLLGHTVSLANIMENGEEAFKNGRGFKAFTTIDRHKDHNGAFNSKLGYMDPRGNHDGLSALLNQNDIGMALVHMGNGISDTQVFDKLDKINSKGTKISANGKISSDNNEARASWLGLNTEGHGWEGGSAGVKGNLTKEDGDLYRKFGEKVYGSSFLYNCISCSNAKGANSFSDWAAKQIASTAGKNTDIMVQGAGIDTPLYRVHPYLGKGGIASSFVGLEMPRLVNAAGKNELTNEQYASLENQVLDEYGTVKKDDGASDREYFTMQQELLNQRREQLYT